MALSDISDDKEKEYIRQAESFGESIMNIR